MTTATLPGTATARREPAPLLQKLLATSPDASTTILRLVLGLIMLPHALQKTLGLLGGYGFAGTMGFFTQQLHIPVLFAVLAIVAETAGALGLITGLLTRVAAFGIFSVMAVAGYTVHRANGFFMNWSGAQAGEGFEFHLLAAGIALALIIRGGGKYSVDGALSRRA